jgi:predicted transcriptional regulator
MQPEWCSRFEAEVFQILSLKLPEAQDERLDAIAGKRHMPKVASAREALGRFPPD